MQEYKIYVKIDSTVNLYRAVGVVLQTVKDTKCSLTIAQDNIIQFLIHGSFIDKVKVHSSLKNNGFELCR